MKIQKFLLAAAAMVFAVACTETPEEPTPTPEIQVAVLPTEVAFAADGGENVVSVVAKGAWTATPSAEWITVEPASGEAGTVSVKVKAAKNEVTEAREGSVVFAVGEEKAEVAVSQQAAIPAGSEQWGLVGDFKDANLPSWKPAEPIELTWDGTYYSIKNFEMNATATFKFVENGPENEWKVNRGYNGLKPMTANYYYEVVADGGNIMVPEAGTYDIYLSADASRFYLMEAGVAPAEAQDSETIVVEQFIPEGLFIVGNGTEFGWDADGSNDAAWLTKGENGIFTWTGKLLAEGTFKFMWEPGNWEPRYTRDADAEDYWTLKYQPAGGTDDQFQVDEDGTYDLTLDVINLTISCVKAEVEEAPVSITIRESEMAEDYIAFNLTTDETVVAASYGVIETSMVDDTFTAEWILSEDGGYALYPEELNTTFETGHRRGVTPGTEYTIFLAYEDVDGNKGLVSVTVTTPGGSAVGDENYEFQANSYYFFNDTEWNEGFFTFYGSEYELSIVLSTEIKHSFDYSIADGTIKNVYFKDANGDRIEDIEAGTFSIYPADGTMYMAWAEFVTVSGKSVIAMYGGTIDELGGSAAGVGEFVVAKAKFYHSSQDTMWDTPVADTRYCLELTSTNNDFVMFVIDNYYPLEAFTSMGTTPFLNGAFMAYDPEYPTDPCVNLELSFMMMYMIQDFTYLQVQSGMPEQDINIFNAMFKAASHADGSVKDFNLRTDGMLAVYSGGDDEGGNDGNVIKKDVTSYGADGWYVYGVWETRVADAPGREYNICDAMFMTDIYFSIFDFTQDADTITAVSPGFYPIISEPTTSGIWANTTENIIDGIAYYIVMPEAEADADGRRYGVTITVPTSIEADDCVIEAYLTAEDNLGNPYILDLKYTGPLKGFY